MRLVGAQEERLALEVFFFFFSTLAKFVFSSVLSLSKFDLKKKKRLQSRQIHTGLFAHPFKPGVYRLLGSVMNK